MNLQPTQHNAVCTMFPAYNREKSSVIMEFGNFDGKVNGEFIVKIYRHGTWRISIKTSESVTETEFKRIK